MSSNTKKPPTLFESFMELVMDSPVFQIPLLLKSINQLVGAIPSILEASKDPERMLAVSQFFSNMVNTTTNGAVAVIDSAKNSSVTDIQKLVATLQNVSYLNDWQKQFFLMHYTGVHIQFVGHTEDGKVVIVSSEPPPEETNSKEDIEKEGKKEVEEPSIPETGV